MNPFARRFKPYFFMYAASIGLLTGIATANFYHITALWLYAVGLIGFSAIVLNQRGSWLAGIGCLIIFFCLGAVRMYASHPIIAEDQVAFYSGRHIMIEGIISQEVERRENHQKATLRVSQLGGRAVGGKLLVTLPLYPELHYGDVLRVTGEVERPEAFDGFAYDRYLAKTGVFAVMYYPSLIVQAHGQGSRWYHDILSVKRGLINRVNELLPEPEASFLGGLLWGAKRSIPGDVLDDFNATGTTHIVALSGYNITVLGLIIFLLAPWLGIGRKRAFWLVLGLILFFVIITGYPASVTRAAIMGGLVLVALRFGGGVKSGLLLAVSSLLMCSWNPRILLDDVGFQLSYLATIGLLYARPLLLVLLKYFNLPAAAREMIAATAAAIIMTAPLIIFQFQRFSLVALPANLLILSVIPMTMALGFSAVLVSYVMYPLGVVLAWLAYVPLTYVIHLTTWLGRLPFAQASVQQPSVWLVMAFYVGLLCIIFYVRQRLPRPTPVV